MAVEGCARTTWWIEVDISKGKATLMSEESGWRFLSSPPIKSAESGLGLSGRLARSHRMVGPCHLAVPFLWSGLQVLDEYFAPEERQPILLGHALSSWVL